MRIRFVLIAPLLLFTIFSFAQGKYFEVLCIKSESIMNYYIGTVHPLNNKSSVKLEYKGKSKKTLLKAILNYVKSRPALRLHHVDSSAGAFVTYRDFSQIANSEKCGATLVACTFVGAVPDDGMVLIDLGYNLDSKIYASQYDAKLSISIDNIVVSDDDVPFNEYMMVQPAAQEVMTSNALLGTRLKKQNLKSAYPESIYDPNGKLINAANKKILEDYYDFYVTDLKNYLDKNLK